MKQLSAYYLHLIVVHTEIKSNCKHIEIEKQIGKSGSKSVQDSIGWQYRDVCVRVCAHAL